MTDSADVAVDADRTETGGSVNVDPDDPRYCPEWRARVAHLPHEFRYEFHDHQGVRVVGRYYCEGVPGVSE